MFRKYVGKYDIRFGEVRSEEGAHEAYCQHDVSKDPGAILIYNRIKYRLKCKVQFYYEWSLFI